MKSKKIKVGVIGLGYVGLPLFLLLSKKFMVYGFDNDQRKINLLKNKKSYISDILANELNKININNFYSIEEIKKISECNFIIICLPTPLKKKSPDMSYIIEAFTNIYKHLKKGQTIILESSVYTGATKKVFKKKLSNKFNLGKNFFLCYSPERIDPGRPKDFKKTSYKNITKLVSGYSPNCLKKIYFLYNSVFTDIYKCDSIEIAETAKLFENIYRSVNIGLVNEMKIISHKLNLNIHKIVDAAGSKPFGFRKFFPGPGVGGHCIPIDPLYMSWISKKNNYNPKFIDLSVKTNKKINKWTIDNILLHLPKKKKTKILVLGLTYKKDVNDLRESPSLKIFRTLFLKKYKLSFSDPYIGSIKIKKNIFYSTIVKNFSKYDCTLLLTDHTDFKYKKILQESKLIIDTRGKYKDFNSPKIIHL
tara:strand:+ start:2895 stop:4154 length:1260 start_codon:yes stop_codon:yes gene_type:complete